METSLLVIDSGLYVDPLSLFLPRKVVPDWGAELQSWSMQQVLRQQQKAIIAVYFILSTTILFGMWYSTGIHGDEKSTTTITTSGFSDRKKLPHEHKLSTLVVANFCLASCRRA